MAVAERFRKHWFIGIFLLCAGVAVGTWALAWQILVLPRDFEIQRLERRLAEPHVDTPSTTPPPSEALTEVVKDAEVRAETSITTTDGGCVIFVKNVWDALNFVDLKVTIGDEEAKSYSVNAGQRLSIRGSRSAYYIDLHSIHGDFADLSVFKGSL